MTPKMSKRLLRAAKAEQEQLEASRDELLRRRDEARGVLEELEHGLYALDERLRLLNRLAGEDLARGAADEEVLARSAVDPSVSSGDLQLLRGTAIRETAVRVLAERGGGPIHYRQWHELLSAAGYVVSGKDPLATLLTQLSRSPVVRRTTSAGIYEIDREAPERLRQHLASLQAELRDVTARRAEPADVFAVRGRRDALVSDINAQERALDEADRVLTSVSDHRTVAAVAARPAA